MTENDYKYELKYTLVSNIQDFLYSCGWSEDTVKRQIKTEDDMWEESDENKEREQQEEREDLKPEYYQTKIGECEYKNNVNYCHGFDNNYWNDNNYNYNYNYNYDDNR